MTSVKKLLAIGCLAAASFSLVLTGALYLIEQDAKSYTIASEKMGESRPYRLYLPSDYNNSANQSYPVIYTVDGERVRNSSLALLSGRMVADQDFILVAIDMIGMRTRDLRRAGAKAFGKDTGGQSEKFLDFIEYELIPHIDRTYRTGAERILAGHSYGGMFTIHTMSLRPYLFDGYLAFSPALNADDRSLDMLSTFLASNQAKGKSLHMNLGWETLHDYDVRFEEARSLILRKNPESFRFTSNRYWLIHGAVPIPGYIEGIKFYFSDSASN